MARQEMREKDREREKNEGLNCIPLNCAKVNN